MRPRGAPPVEVDAEKMRTVLRRAEKRMQEKEKSGAGEGVNKEEGRLDGARK